MHWLFYFTKNTFLRKRILYKVITQNAENSRNVTIVLRAIITFVRIEKAGSGTIEGSETLVHCLPTHIH